MDVTLRQLRYFVAVAERLSFTRAAEELFVSQPALSVQIRQLERALGVELVNRTSRSVTLTDAGRTLHEDLIRVLADLDGATRRASELGGAAGGPLRIVYTASVAYEALPVILDRLAQLEPAVDVATTSAWSVRAVDRVRSGEADIALVREFAGADGVRTEVIRHEPLAAFMSVDHELADHASLAVEDLRDRTILVVPESLAPGFHGLAGRLCERHGFTPSVAILTSPESREPLMAHLRRHPDQLFIGPASVATLTWADVTHVPLEGDDARISLCAVTSTRRSPVADRAMTAIRDAAAEAGWMTG